MALIDTLPTAETLRSPVQILRSLFATLRRGQTAAVQAAPASKRPAHEANYMADIGMEVGF